MSSSSSSSFPSFPIVYQLQIKYTHLVTNASGKAEKIELPDTYWETLGPTMDFDEAMEWLIYDDDPMEDPSDYQVQVQFVTSPLFEWEDVSIGYKVVNGKRVVYVTTPCTDDEGHHQALCNVFNNNPKEKGE
jgi:hypothetical protein